MMRVFFVGEGGEFALDKEFTFDFVGHGYSIIGKVKGGRTISGAAAGQAGQTWEMALYMDVAESGSMPITRLIASR